MSFINHIAEFNANGTLALTESSNYSYDNFMEDMLSIETSIHEAFNQYARYVNEMAVNVLVEDGTDTTTLTVTQNIQKKKLLETLKENWRKIIDAFFAAIDDLYNYIYKQAILNVDFIKKHKSDIMKTEIVYGKHKAESLDNNDRIVAKTTVYCENHSIQTYEKILNSDFSEGPVLDIDVLKKYMTNDRVQKDKLYEYYKTNLLGSTKSIDVDEFNKNSNKEKLIQGLENQYHNVCNHRTKIVKTKKAYNNLSTPLFKPDKDMSNEEFSKLKEQTKELQIKTMAQITSMQVYNKVLLEYCKSCTRILKMFIKFSKVETKKGGEDK